MATIGNKNTPKYVCIAKLAPYKNVDIFEQRGDEENSNIVVFVRIFVNVINNSPFLFVLYKMWSRLFFIYMGLPKTTLPCGKHEQDPREVVNILIVNANELP